VATIQWTGNAAAVAQVNSIVLGGTWNSGQIYTVTIDSKNVSYTTVAPDAANADAAAGLLAALQASTIPEFQEVTWSLSTLTISGTASTAGVPFTNTSSATGAGTLVTSTTTASAGPNDLSSLGNYSTGAYPVNGDTFNVTNSTTAILYGLNQLSAVTLAALNIDASMTANIGLPLNNPAGYVEYRPLYFAVGATLLNIGNLTGGGSQLIQIDLGTVQTLANIQSTGTPASNTQPAVLLKGSNASNELNILQGSVGIAFNPGETARYLTVRTGQVGNPATDVTLTFGSGCTLTGATLSQNGGVVTSYTSIPTVNMTAGTLDMRGTGTITTIDCEAGTVYYRTNGTLTAATFRNSTAVLDCSFDPRPRTITDASFLNGATFVDPAKTVTMTNPFVWDLASLQGSNLGSHFNMKRT